jgi:hypothetical protein
MTLHLIKLCVGVQSIEELKDWVKHAEATVRGQDHITRMFPRRKDEVLAGGSLYWVIKGMVLCRQPIKDLQQVKGRDGIERCRIVFEPKIIAVRPVPRRAFQGWRYLDASDAPPDLSDRIAASGMTEQMRRELAELGLL